MYELCYVSYQTLICKLQINTRVEARDYWQIASRKWCEPFKEDQKHTGLGAGLRVGDYSEGMLL